MAGPSMDSRRGSATLRQHVSGRFEAALFVLAAAVAFLMLLVCANVSNLLLARASPAAARWPSAPR